jgi:ferrous iron transport protein B
VASLLVFFVFALQCMSTLAVMRRETNSWRWPAFAFGYLLTLAYAASFVTQRAVSALMGAA